MRFQLFFILLTIVSVPTFGEESYVKALAFINSNQLDNATHYLEISPNKDKVFNVIFESHKLLRESN